MLDPEESPESSTVHRAGPLPDHVQLATLPAAAVKAERVDAHPVQLRRVVLHCGRHIHPHFYHHPRRDHLVRGLPYRGLPLDGLWSHSLLRCHQLGERTLAHPLSDA